MKNTTILILVSVLACVPGLKFSIVPADYVANLGYGFDVTWSEFKKYMDLYTSNVTQDFASAGFTNVRIRMNEKSPNETFMTRLKGQVQDCLNNNIYPILAYQGFEIQDNINATLEENQQVISNWWGNMALAFKGWDYRISFNILIQISGKYKTNTTAINALYYSVRNAIRAHDTDRIIILAPCKLSDPDYLTYLNFTEANDPYIMAEWHFYAAGPSTDPTNDKYWNDGKTLQERQNILDPIQTAYNYGQQKNVSLWVGAWMAGNYNKGGGFDLVKQSSFGSFMARSLKAKNMPWSINADNKFYNFTRNAPKKWFTSTSTPQDLGGMPVLDAILDPNSISLYTNIAYDGNKLRLSPGNYDNSQLTMLGFTGANSIMIPFDFRVTIYTEDSFSGTPVILTSTAPDLSNTNISSIKIEYLNSYL